MHTSRPRKVLPWAFCFLLVSGILGFLWTHRMRTPPAEIERTQLVSKNQKLYLPKSDIPFSGIMLEHYPGGALQSRSEIAGGLLNGFSVGYYTNGQAQVEEHFKNGVSEGLRRKWYASGAKLSEANIITGKLSGPFRRWHENGLLAEEVQMMDGVPHGKSVSYYPSGFVKIEVTLDRGKMLKQRSWKDGEGGRQGDAMTPSSG